MPFSLTTVVFKIKQKTITQERHEQVIVIYVLQEQLKVSTEQTIYYQKSSFLNDCLVGILRLCNEISFR